MIIIMAVALFLDNLLEIPVVASAFKGIKLAVGVLIFDAGLGMLKKMKKPHARVIAGIACAAMLAINLLSLRISSIVLMLIAAAFGAIMYAVHKKGGANA
jgi:chromate transporter